MTWDMPTQLVVLVVASSPEGMTKYAQFENIIIFPTIFEIYKKNI